jgi:HlyD family secretion protein
MPSKKTTIWSIIAFLIIIGIVYFSILRKPKIQYETTDVQRGTVTETVSASGKLIANDTIRLNFENSGRISEIRIKIGQKVSKGDVLAIMDDSELKLAIDQAKANLDKALADAGANSDAINVAEVSKENAEKTLEDTKSLNDAKIDQAEKKTSNAKQYLDDAQEYYDQVKADHGAADSETKQAKLTLDTAQANYDEAKKAEDVADEQADLSKTEVENALNSARANLDSVRSQFVTAGNNAVVAAAKAAYDEAFNNLGKTVLKAPAAGVIKAVNFKAGEVAGLTSINSNTGAANSSTFAEMISYDFIFEAQVPESDINKITVGQTAELTFDAFSADEKFSGQVVSIEPSATVVQDVVDYVVKVALDSIDSRFRDGMSADIDFLITKKNNALYIPERAVQGEGDAQFVEILNEKNQQEKRSVKTGLKGDGGVIEILSGLNEGEKVITATK